MYYDFIGTNNKNIPVQYRRAHESCAIFDISERDKLVLGGKDHLKFLQNIITNDVLKLSAGEGVHSLMLNRKGRVLADMRLFRKDSETCLDIEPETGEPTAKYMEQLKLSYRVEIKNESGRALFHLAGPGASEAVSRVLGRDVRKMSVFEHCESAGDDARLWTARTDRVGVPGFDIETGRENAGEILGIFEENGVFPASAETFEILRDRIGNTQIR